MTACRFSPKHLLKSILFLIGTSLPLKDCASEEGFARPFSLHVSRASRNLLLLDAKSRVIHRANVGIGSGGLGRKKSMTDHVTPTGQFSIEIILYEKGEFNRIDGALFTRYKNHPLMRGKEPHAALRSLFNNMRSLDFNGDRQSDNAYGDGYLGLKSTEAITGPKLISYRGIPYWFSIALHGTPNPENIGKANSGGCVHLPSDTLTFLIEGGYVELGTNVTITDEHFDF